MASGNATCSAISPRDLPPIDYSGTRRVLSVHVRICRDCGEEYRPEIAVCADCGGALEDRWGDEDAATVRRPAGPAAPEAPDRSGFRPIFVTSQATILVPPAEC